MFDIFKYHKNDYYCQQSFAKLDNTPILTIDVIVPEPFLLMTS
jgi:hypothetical protein